MRHIDLYFTGGGGMMGYWFGETGVFAWLPGTGDAGRDVAVVWTIRSLLFLDKGGIAL